MRQRACSQTPLRVRRATTVLNHPPSDPHTLDESPIAMNRAVLLPRRRAQVHAAITAECGAERLAAPGTPARIGSPSSCGSGARSAANGNAEREAALEMLADLCSGKHSRGLTARA